jgi:hypothetical protein
MTEPQTRPRGLCEGIALLASSERAWTADKYDPAFVFAVSYSDLREAVALGREVRKTPNKNNIHGRLASCIKTLRDDVNIRFQNWQPTKQQRKWPH